jgi:hypothetical protein
MLRESLKSKYVTRDRVPMEYTEADQSVVAMKVLEIKPSKGTDLFNNINRSTKKKWEESMNKVKSYKIPKQLIMQAYLKVKANKGAAGIDEETIDEFERELKNNLYKIWNRISSGSYFPPAVKGIDIPKKSGGKRTLGIPTVRINCT